MEAAECEGGYFHLDQGLVAQRFVAAATGPLCTGGVTSGAVCAQPGLDPSNRPSALGLSDTPRSSSQLVLPQHLIQVWTSQLLLPHSYCCLVLPYSYCCLVLPHS